MSSINLKPAAKEEEDDYEVEEEVGMEDEDEDEDEDDYDEDEDVYEEVEGVEETKENEEAIHLHDEDEDEEEELPEEEEDLNEDYFQKIDASYRNTIISEHHPELNVANYDEIEVLTKIVRDNNGNIIDPFHKTLPFITKYEKARVLGERARQIDAGCKSFIDIPKSSEEGGDTSMSGTMIMDGYLLAKMEFEQKKIPFIIQRPLPNNTCEYWKVSDLEII